MEAGELVFLIVFLLLAGSFLFRLATQGMLGMAVGAKVVREHLAFDAKSSGMVNTQISVVTTDRRAAPVAVAVVRRAPLGFSASGVNLTRDQALSLAALLRAAADEPEGLEGR